MVKKGFFFLCKVRKHYFQAYFDEIQIKKKLAFLAQKHGLTPLKKCDLLDFEKGCFLQSKRFLLSLQCNLSIISTLILTKSEQIKKMAFFDQKHGLTPLKKCVFLNFEKFCFLRSKTFLFSLQSGKALFLGLF